MNQFGAIFTITLLIIILIWPFIAIYIDKKINSRSTRPNFTTSDAFDYLDVYSDSTPTGCSCKQRRYTE